MSNSQSPMPPFNQREEALFAAALERPASERATFLDGACHSNPALRQRLEALLAAHDQPDNLVPTQAEAARLTIKLDLADAPDEAVGQTLGRYKLLERVGEGGCGVVYVAEQTEPVRRRVALKVIKLGMDTKQVVARFEAERQALAMMDHPNIAKVLDAGTTELGRPFFVMELVRGIKITDYCDQANLSTKERLDLFIKVCQAIQHAHQKGIIHRDIKPSNILVTLHDGVPVPKVIDFGIAKATEGKLTDATVYTQLHQFIGTPAYMSPEQAEMSGLDIDTRSDIYSLGVLLYELLAGSTPFDPKELMASGIDAMRKTIREKEPPRPSTKLSQTLVAANVSSLKSSDGKPTTEEEVRASSRRLLRVKETVHHLKGDLDWIVMKCLEKDRQRRYETANGLAADLKRHLDNEPVTARPPSAAYRLQKAFRRNKLLFAAGTAIAAALALGIVGTSSGLIRAEQQRRAAEQSRQLAEQRFQSASRFVEDVFKKVAPEFSDLIGATKARQALAQTSVSFLESIRDAGGNDKAFQLDLAALYGQLASALGNPLVPNSVGDYSNAMQFAQQSLAILQTQQKQYPDDKELLQKLSQAHDRIGLTLTGLERSEEALSHFQRELELNRQLLDRYPDDPQAQRRLLLVNFRIGNVLARGLGRASEALERHYLPYGQPLLDRALDPALDSSEVHMCYVAHFIVGVAEMQLDRATNALPHFEQALQWKQMLIDREPNEARSARDWSGIHAEIGTALILVGRSDEGMTNLQMAVDLAERVVARDPLNGSSQALLIECLRKHAQGAAKVARAPETAPGRRSELWQQAVQSLTRCQERLAAPELARIQFPARKSEKDVKQALAEARDALAKIAANSENKAAKP